MKARKFWWAWHGEDFRRDSSMTTGRATAMLRSWRRDPSVEVTRNGEHEYTVTRRKSGIATRMRWTVHV